MQTFVKDGREVAVFNATDAVNLKAKGWKEKAEKPKKPAHKATHPVHETHADPEPAEKPAEPDK